MLKGKYQAPILLIVLAMIWGSSFILMKRGLHSFTGMQVGSLRMIMSFILLLPFTIKFFPQVDKKKYFTLFIVGLTGNGLPALLFAVAQTKINSSTAGVLNSLTPIFTMLFGFIFLKQSFGIQKISGVFIGLMGAIVLVLLRSNGAFESNYAYGLLIVLATLCYGISVNLVKSYLHDMKSLAISGFALVGMGPPLAVYLFGFTDFVPKLQSDPAAMMSLWYIFLLSLFGTAIALILYNQLVKVTDALYASLVTYLIPIVALVWGVLDMEKIGWVHFVGIGLILAGIYLGRLKQKIRIEKAHVDLQT